MRTHREPVRRRPGLLLLGTALLLWPAWASAQLSFSFYSASSEPAAPPKPTWSWASLVAEPVVAPVEAVEAPIAVEPEIQPEWIAWVPDPEPAVEVSQGAFVQTERRLVVDGGGADAPLEIEAGPRRFADWPALFEALERELGATLVHDADGEVVAASGRFVRTGGVVFVEPDGSAFEAVDYVAAYLGGRSGVAEVAGQALELGRSDAPVSWLRGTDEDCVGESCVEGHVWLTHYPFYHSAGARTEQVRGGTEEIVHRYCASGEPVLVDGVEHCRVRNPEAWTFDPELRVWLQDPFAGDPWVVVPADTRTRVVYRNELSVGTRLVFGPADSEFVQETAPNTDVVEMGGWTVIRDVFDEVDGSFAIPLEDVSGLCGVHASTAGGYVETAEGSTGDDDVLCGGPQPF